MHEVDIPRGLLRCPSHPADDETTSRIVNGVRLSTSPAARITYECGLSVRVEWPTEWNEAHPEYRFWGPVALGGDHATS